MRWNGQGGLVCPLRGQSLESRLAAQRSVVRALVVATVREGSLLERSEPTRYPSGRSRVAVQHPSRGRGGRAVSHGPLVHPWPPGRAAASLGQTGKRQERKERVVASNKPVLVGWVVVSHWQVSAQQVNPASAASPHLLPRVCGHGIRLRRRRQRGVDSFCGPRSQNQRGAQQWLAPDRARRCGPRFSSGASR